MNPSYTPIADGPWGVPMPGHATNIPALDPAVSPELSQQDVEEPFECQSCGKQYARLCDLNKHLKTHSRPFKCPVEDCRYHTFGWPTDKELDRHYNDKHSTEPKTFSCLWHDCNYTSKRESNCKQHMEKAHGYHYVRSRAGNRDEDYNRPFGPPGNVSPQPDHPRTRLALRTVPDVLLTPSPLEQCLSATSDAPSPMGLTGPTPYGPDVYIPWNSPVTRLRDNETFLQEFSQAYGPGTPITVQDNEWLRVPVDPRLYNPVSSGTNTPDESPVIQVSSTRDEIFKSLPTIVTPRTSPTVTSQVLTPVSEPSPTQVQNITFRTETTTPQDTETPRDQGFAGSQGLGVSHAGHLNPYGKRHVRFAGDQGDDSDGDDEPPVKRPKAPGGNDEDVGDPKMICPFRKAHPEIYDLNAHSKYWSCHTEHHNISTVVRHLGRPAHNLEVDNARQAISSFNVTDTEHGHPAAGLCKKCWRAFTDREAFDDHFRTKCETVSRSKREKFQILLDTFCGTTGDSSDSDPEDLEDAEGDAEEAHTSATSSRSHLREESVVSRSEYLTLVDRVATLERVLAVRMPQSTPRTLPNQQAAVARAFASSSALSSEAFGYYSYDSGPSGGAAAMVGSSGGGGGGGGSDPRTSVVGGMDSQPVRGGGDQRAVGGFYSDTERIRTGFRPSVSIRSDSISTVRRPSPLTVTGGSGAGQPQPQPQLQQPGNNNSNNNDNNDNTDNNNQGGQAVSESAYGTDVAAASAAAAGRGGGGGARVASGHPPLVALPSSHQQQHHHHHHQAQQQQVEAFGSNDTQTSQQSTNAMMRDRWEQAVEAGEVMMERMDFFHGGSSGDDISKFLDMNMDSQ